MGKMKNVGILMICWGLLCGCSTKSEKLEIAVIVKSTTSQFFKSVHSGANAASKEYNIELTFMGPENEEDYQSQIAMVDTAIRYKVDAIVLSSIDYVKLVEPVENAIAQGIPVIIIDSDVKSDKVSTRITTNNFEAGQMAGDAILTLGERSLNVGI
ncbi:MAG: substrate-binding domain-containing protein, partial [Coprobacillus sp.]